MLIGQGAGWSPIACRSNAQHECEAWCMHLSPCFRCPQAGGGAASLPPLHWQSLLGAEELSLARLVTELRAAVAAAAGRLMAVPVHSDAAATEVRALVAQAAGEAWAGAGGGAPCIMHSLQSTPAAPCIMPPYGHVLPAPQLFHVHRIKAPAAARPTLPRRRCVAQGAAAGRGPGRRRRGGGGRRHRQPRGGAAGPCAPGRHPRPRRRVSQRGRAAALTFPLHNLTTFQPSFPSLNSIQVCPYA